MRVVFQLRGEEVERQAEATAADKVVDGEMRLLGLLGNSEALDWPGRVAVVVVAAATAATAAWGRSGAWDGM